MDDPTKKQKRPLEQVSELNSRLNQALEALVPVARSAANVLKDAGHPSTARQLDEALFAIDAVKGEINDFVSRDPMALVQLLRESFEKR